MTVKIKELNIKADFTRKGQETAERPETPPRSGQTAASPACQPSCFDKDRKRNRER